jgi:cbb3-type cytochrome oxidase maturation protein
MSVLIILILASLAVAIGFLAAFIWSVRAGQYDDDYTPSVRMLFDDNVNKKTEINREQSDKKP